MHDDVTATATTAAVVHLLFALLSLLMHLGFLAVALTAVKKAHAGAGTLMAASAGLASALAILGPIMQAAIPYVVGFDDGAGAMLRAQMVIGGVLALAGLGASAMLLVAIVRLAESKRP
jgi:hypothetical protein